jgi:ribosomal protein S18 acetylase RimI-like enzyme
VTVLSADRARLIEAASPEHVEQVRTLFLEYAKSLSFSLCFQSFDEEVKNLPGNYASPSGRLYLSLLDSRPAGCIALRKLDEDICEMKRLYVRPEARGHGLGRILTERVIAAAREIGYKRMRLDTIASSMKEAVELYRRLGFKEIAPYTKNPIEGALYMELLL